jgi:hypothetical protein
MLQEVTRVAGGPFDFLIAQDILMTSERRVQRMRKALDPPRLARDDGIMMTSNLEATL